MTPGNVWLDGRQREASALDAIITVLETAPEATDAGQAQAAVGAGTAARADAAIARQDERHAR